MRKANSGVLPLPVGIAIAIHRITGSTHTVPGTLTTEWDMKKLIKRSNPLTMASGGMSIAFPI